MAVVVSAVAVAAAQSELAFDVASVKRTPRSAIGGGPASTPGRFRVTNSPLRFILLDAFGVMDHQLIGAPQWTESARYDITATYRLIPLATTTTLERCCEHCSSIDLGLKTHREMRELPIYSLVMARKDGALGPQLVRSAVDCEQWIAEKRPQMAAGSASPVARVGRGQSA
jgi:uncharacterized protein (TIGR03435 family)